MSMAALNKNLTGKEILFINTVNIHNTDRRNKKLVNKYRITQVPTLISVDKNGNILARN